MNLPRWLQFPGIMLRWRARTQSQPAAASSATDEARRALRRTRMYTPLVRRYADRVSQLPADEFTRRVARAFGRPPA